MSSKNTSKQSSLGHTEKFLANHQNKGLLRLITCGSVDDGKSTLTRKTYFMIRKYIFGSIFAVETQIVKDLAHRVAK